MAFRLAIETMQQYPLTANAKQIPEPSIDTFLITIPIIPLATPQEMMTAGEIELYLYWAIYERNHRGTPVERRGTMAESRWKSGGKLWKLVESRRKIVERRRNRAESRWNGSGTLRKRYGTEVENLGTKRKQNPPVTHAAGGFLMSQVCTSSATCILFPVFYTSPFQERPQSRHQRGGKYRHGHERNPGGNGRDRVPGNSFRVQDWEHPDRNLSGQAFRTIPKRVGQPGPGAFKFVEPQTISGEDHFRRGKHFGEHDGKGGDLEG